MKKHTIEGSGLTIGIDLGDRFSEGRVKRLLDVPQRSQQRERNLQLRRLLDLDELERIGLLGMLVHGGGSFLVL